MTFEEAISIAKKTGCKFNACDEYEKGYRFFDNESDADGDCGVVIIKENGRAINFVSFIFDYSPENTPKHIKLQRVKRG